MTTHDTTTLYGYAAIEYAEKRGLATLNKATDPTEEAREVSIGEARDIVTEAPDIVWIDTTNNATTDHAVRMARIMREARRQEHAGALVEREVMCCVSTIVHGLAQSEEACRAVGLEQEEVWDVCRRDDWQTAAEEEGWSATIDKFQLFGRETTSIPGATRSRTILDEFEYTSETYPQADDWCELCEAHDIDPYTVEAYEHWAVSDWFGSKLAERGEMVAFDFAGLPAVWGRTCTGQAIALDDVVQRIACDNA